MTGSTSALMIKEEMDMGASYNESDAFSTATEDNQQAQHLSKKRRSLDAMSSLTADSQLTSPSVDLDAHSAASLLASSNSLAGQGLALALGQGPGQGQGQGRGQGHGQAAGGQRSQHVTCTLCAETLDDMDELYQHHLASHSDQAFQAPASDNSYKLAMEASHIASSFDSPKAAPFVPPVPFSGSGSGADAYAGGFSFYPEAAQQPLHGGEPGFFDANAPGQGPQLHTPRQAQQLHNTFESANEADADAEASSSEDDEGGTGKKRKWRKGEAAGVDPKLSNACNECTKDFASTQGLRNHVQTVHEKKRDFQCDKCAKRFSANGSLKRHIETVHQGKKKFECGRCQRLFALKHHLKNHMITVHMETNVDVSKIKPRRASLIAMSQHSLHANGHMHGHGGHMHAHGGHMHGQGGHGAGLGPFGAHAAQPSMPTSDSKAYPAGLFVSMPGSAPPPPPIGGVVPTLDTLQHDLFQYQHMLQVQQQEFQQQNMDLQFQGQHQHQHHHHHNGVYHPSIPQPHAASTPLMELGSKGFGGSLTQPEDDKGGLNSQNPPSEAAPVVPFGISPKHADRASKSAGLFAPSSYQHGAASTPIL